MSSEKTEEPTDKKLRDSRKKGQVAQSQDVNKLFVTIAGFELLIALKDSLIEKIQSMMDIALSLSMADAPFEFAATEVAGRMIYIGLGITLTLCCAVIVARFVAGWIQFGFLIAPESMKLDMNKLDPVSNGKNLFKMKKVVELFVNIAKATVLFFVFYYIIETNLNDIVLSATGTLEKSIDIGANIFVYAARISLLIFGILAMVDFVIQKHLFIKSQKMTKDEVYREYKQAEGDPHVKAGRKQLGQEIVNSSPVQESVDDASAVVVNPTHFAIVLRYVPGETPLPKVLCIGADERAQQIIRLAKEGNVPVIKYVWLARTLYRTGKENRYIPRGVIKPMAAVFKAIKEMEASEFKDNSVFEIKE
ncbi:MAG: type III secretion protein U [Cellvibrionaceae bacterium]|jgi:type III secretion protein U